MKKIIATFKGQNGSNRFITDMEYELNVDVIRTGTHKGYIEITGLYGKNCTYESFIAFLNNWNNIRVI